MVAKNIPWSFCKPLCQNRYQHAWISSDSTGERSRVGRWSDVGVMWNANLGRRLNLFWLEWWSYNALLLFIPVPSGVESMRCIFITCLCFAFNSMILLIVALWHMVSLAVQCSVYGVGGTLHSALLYKGGLTLVWFPDWLESQSGEWTPQEVGNLLSRHRTQPFSMEISINWCLLE